MSVFDDVPASSRLVEDDHFFIIRDGFPVSPGHLLIVSKRDVVTFFDLIEHEHAALSSCLILVSNILSNNHSIIYSTR